VDPDSWRNEIAEIAALPAATMCEVTSGTEHTYHRPCTGHTTYNYLFFASGESGRISFSQVAQVSIISLQRSHKFSLQNATKFTKILSSSFCCLFSSVVRQNLPTFRGTKQHTLNTVTDTSRIPIHAP